MAQSFGGKLWYKLIWSFALRNSYGKLNPKHFRGRSKIQRLFSEKLTYASTVRNHNGLAISARCHILCARWGCVEAMVGEDAELFEPPFLVYTKSFNTGNPYANHSRIAGLSPVR